MGDTTELSEHIQATPLVDSHEHLASADEYRNAGPDVLAAIFHHYVISDLWAAGASREALDRLQKRDDPDVAARFEGVREAWERVQHTGYGDASCLIAGEIFGIEEITGETLAQAQSDLAGNGRGGRLAILRDHANLDHVQIDSFVASVAPDAEDPSFFLHDLSVYPFAAGEPDLAALQEATGITVSNSATYRDALEALFEHFGPMAIACKTQHAYVRTLGWTRREDSEVDEILGATLADGGVSNEANLALGDWALDEVCRLAAQHLLPVKIHTGYHAGNDAMPLADVAPSLLCPLLAAHPETRFVLMHTGYPYSGEIAALAKHYRNVYADLCWAWAVDPHNTADFVRHMIHTAPSHKLFAFGGDTSWPEATLAFAIQAREGLTRALQAEIDSGYLGGGQACRLATAFMKDNALGCFDVEGRRRVLANAV